MLELLRKALKSWVAKLLIVLLIASFAVWGIGDVFGGRSGATVAYVGETELTAPEYARAMQQRRAAISQRAERVIGFDELRAFGLDREILGQMVRQKALVEEARILGLSAPDEAVSRDIRRIFGGEGGFSAAEYREQLRRQGYTPAEFEELQRGILAQRILLRAVAGAPAPVGGVAEAIARRQGETRTARIIRLGPDDVEQPEAPDEATLTAYFDQNRENYTAPERRSGSFVLVEVAPLLPELMPEEEAIRAEYEALRDNFTQPGTRDIDQIVLSDAEAARDAMARLAAGEITFEELAAEQGFTPDQVAFGQVTAAELPAATAEAVFATSEPGLVGPVDTGIGHAILRVNAATDEMTIPFEVISMQLGLEMARNAAIDVVRDKAVEVEDLRAASVPFAEIAERAGVTAGSFEEIDTAGTGPDGAIAEGIPADELFLAEVFTAETGAGRDMVQLSDGSYALVLVEEVTPARPLTLEEARERVIADWTADEIAARLDALGERLAGFAAGVSGDVRAIAAGRGAQVSEIGPFDRYEPPAALGAELTGLLFETPEGDAVHGATPDGSGVIVAEVGEIIPAPEDALGEAAAQLDGLLAESIAADAMEYYGRALEAGFEAGVDPEAIEAVFNELSTY